MYILGSIHSLPSNGLPLPSHVEAAYAEAAVVAFEVDLATVMEGNAAVTDQISNEQLLGDAASVDLLAEVNAVLAVHGLQPGALDYVEPWYAALLIAGLEMNRSALEARSAADSLATVSASAPVTMAPGVDQYLYERAPIEGKRLVFLEDVSSQFNVFDELSTEDQLRYLQAILEPTDEPNYQTLFDAWGSGNDKAIVAWMNDSMAQLPELTKALLGRRNRAWVPEILRMLRHQSDASMVVVGAAHLFGPDSVIALLIERGYTVERL